MKHFSSRRNFLKTSSILLAIAFSGTGFDLKKYKPLLSFSTLGCPDWSFEDIVNFAAKNNYAGIELRGIKRELDLTKCSQFNSPQNILNSKKALEEKSLKFVDLGSSAEMHHKDEAEREKNLDNAKRFIDLA